MLTPLGGQHVVGFKAREAERIPDRLLTPRP